MDYIRLSLLVTCCLLPLTKGGLVGLLGAPKIFPEPEELTEYTNLINEAQNTDGLDAPFNASRIVCATKQLVFGNLFKIYYLVPCSDDDCAFKQCEAKVLVQPLQKYSVHAEVKCDQDARDGVQTCKQLKKAHQSRPKRSVGNNIGVVTMEKSNDGYDTNIKPYFDEFIKSYEREYSESGNSEVYQQKYKVFEKNFKIMKSLNEMGDNAVYGITKFMDYSYDEYKKYLAPGFTKQLVSIREADMSSLDVNGIPESVDWREKGAVTAVKNQGQCGSCWAFSTTGNVEGQWFLKHGKLWSLSEQELVDCDSLDQGCNGGLPSNAYKSIEKLGGLETESDYPYEAANEKCSVDKADFKVSINDSVALSKDEGELAAWLAKNGPISIGINANMMQFYFGGIAHPWKIFCNPKSLDHGVLIVGYGTENGTPYWIIKNSWGPNWGEKGYYRIYRGDGSCGLNQMATSSIVD
uniref:Cathepsin L-like n=1 Tax=Phallusia mammillata TaxID=59560 RepID=A0A6F9D9L9_9ASCI|nr:cathepsin L-like [Phallusia mammillata]